MKKIILSIDGMTCSACSNGLEKYLNNQNGIINANVNLVMANATVTYDEKILDQEKIEKYVKQAGFKSLGIFKELNIEKNNKKEKTEFIVFTILAIILTFKFNNLGYIGLLPLISTVSYIWLMNIKDVRKFKLLIIFTMLMWLIYDVVIKSYTSAIFDFMSIIANMLTLLQIKLVKN